MAKDNTQMTTEDMQQTIYKELGYFLLRRRPI